MRVGIDLRRLHDTGIGRYSRNLTKALLAQGLENEFVLILGRADDVAILGVDSQRVKWIISPARRYSLRELISPLLIAHREKLDLLHVPHQFHLPLCRDWATVVTVHDLTQIVYPPSRTAQRFRLLYAIFLWLACMRADRVCTDSIAARNGISTVLGIPVARISVVAGAVDPIFVVEHNQGLLQALRARKSLPSRIILYVGNWKSHKNLDRLIQAFALLMRGYDAGIDVGLVIVGQPDPENEHLITQTTEELGITERVCLTGRLSDTDLKLIYNLADVFVQPSLSEGFGLTLLEAMACGTPVVASRIPPHEEIVGNAAILVDPFSVDNIAQAINRVLLDENLAHEMRDEGLRNVQKFSWERTAKETLAIYNEVMSNRSRKTV